LTLPTWNERNPKGSVTERMSALEPGILPRWNRNGHQDGQECYSTCAAIFMMGPAIGAEVAFAASSTLEASSDSTYLSKHSSWGVGRHFGGGGRHDLAATSAAAEPHFVGYATKTYLKGKSILPTGSLPITERASGKA
jgi:hypothetical protein